MKNESNFLSLNIRGELHTWTEPIVMGIVNVTPDSFYASSRVALDELCNRVAEMISSGAQIIDIGGYSSRPGAENISAEVELGRLLPALNELRHSFPECIISVDTFRADVARKCVEAGADIINDIGGGVLDNRMFETIADLKVPYVLMHTRGTPATMQSLTDYADVTAEVLSDLAFKADTLHSLGVCDVIVDPGFGFAKTTQQNFELLSHLHAFKEIGPVLAGMSRKSMITKTLDVKADEALNGTTALNMVALINGASILRVHDVKEAVETVKLFIALQQAHSPGQQVISTTYSDNTRNTTIF